MKRAMSALAAFTLVVPALALAGGGGGKHHGPPPAAFDACKGKAEGDACTFKGRKRTVPARAQGRGARLPACPRERVTAGSLFGGGSLKTVSFDEPPSSWPSAPTTTGAPSADSAAPRRCADLRALAAGGPSP